MVALFLTTTILCSDAVSIINRLTKVVGLTSQQRIEIISTIQKSIPSCPLIIKPNESKRTSGT
jgi:hypothetical protein